MLSLGSSRRFAHAFVLAAVIVTALLAFSLSAHAAGDESEKETIISAKSMRSDQDSGVVVATGQVEIARGGYILHADKVTYDQKSGVMHAEGNVAMLTPSGDVQFAEAEDITGDMKQAFLQNMSILFPDNSRMAAKSAQRYEGRYTVADTANYTACNVCKENPDQPPLWQMRAKEIVHDNEEHNIYYHDATMDFAGVPVFYTPYMSTPDPTVDRRQGLLDTIPGYSPLLGGFVSTPYYFDIAPDKDAILAPTFSQTDKLQVAGEYRERFANGSLQLDGSVTRADLVSDANIDEGQNWRGHLFGKFLYDIDNVWRAGSDVNFTSDKSYLYRYRLGNPDELTTRNYVEGFSGRDYASVNNYYFEDLRPGTQAVQPIVLPQANFSAYGEPGQTFGGRWSLDGNTLITTRDNAGQSLWQQGPDTRRVAVTGGWDRRIISDSTGIVTKLDGLLHLDSYYADNVVDPNGTTVYNNVLLARQFEQADATVSYPMSRQGGSYQQLLEPIAGFTLAPDFYNSAKQPIEESQNITFDETNLFSPNRFTGYDLIEGGSRFTYGLRHMITTDSGGRLSMFGGQSYDFSRNSAFSDLTGLQDHLSDFVGNINLEPADWINMSYETRLDHSTLQPEQQYASLSAGVPLFRPYIRYTSGYSLGTDSIIEKIDDATVGFDSKIAKYWLVHAEHTQGFDPGPGPRSTALSLGYIDDCYVFVITANQDDTQQVGGLSSGTSVVFHMFFRNLGGVHTDGATSAAFPPEFRQAL